MRPLFTKVQFDWLVAANGYAIKPEKSTHVTLVPTSGPQLRTRPFHKYPGLFKQFAAMPASAEGAVQFADKFGLLQGGDHGNELAIWLQNRTDFAELTAIKSSDNATLLSAPARIALERVNCILRSGITVEISEAGGVVVKPRDLLAAMAFQLGMWLGTDNERFGQCVECGATWIYGPGTGHRVNRRYCSTNCQDAARYRRKKSKLGAFWRR